MTLVISVKPTAEAAAIDVATDLPESFDALVEKYSQEEVYFHAIANMVVKAQGIVRAHHAKVAAGKESKLPDSMFEACRPRPKVDQVAKARKALAGLSPEDIKALLKEASKK